MLPDVDGLMLLIALKSLIDAPVVICSARDEQVDRVLGLRLGAADFVGKPFDLHDLESRIEGVLATGFRHSQARPPPPVKLQIGNIANHSKSRGVHTLKQQSKSPPC